MAVFKLSDYDLICTDWSGVISNDLAFVHTVNCQVMEHFGKPPLPMEEWRSIDTTSAMDFLRKFGVEGSNEELFKVYRSFLDRAVSEGRFPVLCQGAPQALSHFKDKGKKVVVISNHPTESIREEAKRYGVLRFLDEIMGSRSEKWTALMDAMRKYNSTPERTLFIGDMRADIQAAKRVGVPAAAVYSGYHSREFLQRDAPQFMFKNIFEVAAERC